MADETKLMARAFYVEPLRLLPILTPKLDYLNINLYLFHPVFFLNLDTSWPEKSTMARNR